MTYTGSYDDSFDFGSYDNAEETMRNFFISIRDRLEELGDLKYVRMWNNQLELVQAGKMELFQSPAAFLSFKISDIMQGGEGVQIYDPLIIEVRILHWQLDAADGNFEQNLDVFDLKQKIYKHLQKFKTAKSGSIIRIAEEQDTNHAGLYMFIQTYRTTLVDDVMQEPVGGGEFNPIPKPLEVQLETQRDDANEPHVYNFTPAP